MTERRMKLALLLAGGGARSAYQAGVVEAVAELPFDICAVSAVGAGALNGSIVAAAPDAAAAAKELRQLWERTLDAAQSVLRLGPVPVVRLGAYLTLLFAGGVEPTIEEKLRGGMAAAGRGRQLRRLGSGDGSSDLVGAAIELVAEQLNVGTDAELDRLVSATFAEAAANPAIPFYVSVYESDEGLFSMLRHAGEGLGLLPLGAPRYIDVSDPALPAQERLAAVLASATLPFLCEPRAVAGRRFIDGSFAGMAKSPGAVPLVPLLRDSRVDADMILVVHTEPGIAWSADFGEGPPILQLRPTGEAGDVGYFWADRDSLEGWIRAGRDDATRVLTRLLAARRGWSGAAQAREALERAAKGLDEDLQ